MEDSCCEHVGCSGRCSIAGSLCVCLKRYWPVLTVVAAAACGFWSSFVSTAKETSSVVLCTSCPGSGTLSPEEVDHEVEGQINNFPDEVVAEQVDRDEKEHIRMLPNEIDHGEDHINNLPDEVLSYIISFLTIRDAAKTGLLSRRWRYLCSSMPNLKLDWFTLSGAPVRSQYSWDHLNLCSQYRRSYVLGLNQVFNWYRDQKLISLQLSFCFGCEYDDIVDEWFYFAAERKVEKLDLSFVCLDYPTPADHHESCDRYQLSGFVLSKFSELKHLRLYSCMLMLDECTVKTLKVLDLHYVNITSSKHYSKTFNALNLEWLRLRRCRIPGTLNIGELQHLKFLMVADCQDLEGIKILAQNLTTFEYIGKMNVPCTFGGSIRLANMFLLPQLSGVHHYGYGDFAKNFCDLNTLTVTACHTSLVHQYPTSRSAFLRVRELQLLILAHDDGSDLVELLSPLLSSLCLLEKLYILMPGSMNYVGETTHERVECDLNHLREAEICGFDGSRNHLEFASYLLGNAPELEHLIIKASFRWYDGCNNWKYVHREACFNHEFVREQLNGKAASAKAELIIR